MASVHGSSEFENNNNNNNIHSIDEEDELKVNLKPINTETTLFSDVSTITNETFITTVTNSNSCNKISSQVLEADINNEINECGCCFIKFKNHQHLANIKLFVFFMCVTVLLTNALCAGYRSSVVTTIEKIFELSSSMSGILSGCLEVGSLISTLFVSYFLANKSIPKCIAASSLLCSIGSIMYAVPHFITNYNIKNELIDKATNNLICQLNNNSINDQLLFSNKEECFEKSTNVLLFILLIIANVLIGSSSAPLYTLGTTYIDNHVNANNSSIYLGFMYSMLAFGPVST